MSGLQIAVAVCEFLSPGATVNEADRQIADSVLPVIAAKITALLTRDVHVVDVGSTEFGLQHGFPCRPDLLGCPVNVALNCLDGPPAPVGRYHVWLDDAGEVIIGDRVAADYDPLVTELRALAGAS